MYRTVFDLADEGFRHRWLIALIVLFVVLRGGIAWFRRRGSRDQATVHLFSLVLVGTVILMAAVTLVPRYAEYVRLSAALEHGDFEVVEGLVTDFVPIGSGGDGLESFVVDGRRFEYSDSLLTTGFHATRRRGGPMDDGLKVRVSHVDGTIVRLEIWR